MKNSGKKLSLTSYDDIFTTEDARQENQRERVMEIPLDKLQHFRDHPFQVRHDQALQDMADSIKEYGVLSPGLARPIPDGSGYEVISGNRRLEACILAGMETMPVIVRDMSDDEAKNPFCIKTPFMFAGYQTIIKHNILPLQPLQLCIAKSQ